MSGRVPVVLTIAGFDPSSGAGVTADLKVISAMHAYGMAAVTALTVQSTAGVREVEPVRGALLRDTLACLAADVEFAAVKLGMLGSAEAAAVVADFIEEHSALPVVLDPVVRSSSGALLLPETGIEVLRQRLLPRVTWVTPNLDELALLTGLPAGKAEEVTAAARQLRDLGGRRSGARGLNVVVTGGHLRQPDDYLLAGAADESGRRTPADAGIWIRGERVATTSTHGTGCAFSTALACRIAGGDGPEAAVRAAKAYVTGALRGAYPVGKGRGPMDHFWAGIP